MRGVAIGRRMLTLLTHASQPARCSRQGCAFVLRILDPSHQSSDLFQEVMP
jgi:hypothetical protein